MLEFSFEGGVYGNTTHYAIIKKILYSLSFYRKRTRLIINKIGRIATQTASITIALFSGEV